MHQSQLELCDVIDLAALRPTIVPSLPTHNESGVRIVHKAICYFHLLEHELPVRVNSFAFYENRYVDIQEDIDGYKRIVRYGVCSPCAEQRRMVQRQDEE